MIAGARRRVLIGMSEVGRLVRFGAVGVTNTVIAFATFALLAGVGIPPAAASAVAFAVGAANGYRLNRRWTFRVQRGDTAMAVRYVAVQIVGAGLSAAGVALATQDLDLRRLAAEALVLPFVTLMTYVLSRRLVFGVGARAA
jgi:putative flippase GtrA